MNGKMCSDEEQKRKRIDINHAKCLKLGRVLKTEAKNNY